MSTARIRLSDHFTYPTLIRFTLPTILMMVITSMYSIVDGLFVSNLVGTTAFAAINLTWPVIMCLGSLGLMFGTGGSAVLAKTLGEKQHEQACRYFTLFVLFAALLSALLAIIGFIFMGPIARLLGAQGALMDNAVIYGRIMFAALPALIVQYIFQSFLVVAEKPTLSLVISVASGITNMILDYVFIALFGWGLGGAAFATLIGQVVGGCVPVIYFLRPNNSLLHFARPQWRPRVLLNACTNGASEMVTHLSASVVNILYNFQLMALAGENGIAAYGVIMYLNIIFMGIFMGYAIGSAPIVGFHYGALNTAELKNLFLKGSRLMIGGGALLFIFSFLLARPLVAVFVHYDPELLSMTVAGFKVYAIAFMFMGTNVWASSFFTALNNGLISALISFLRTLVFQIGCILILPKLLGLNGVWLSVVIAELLALIVSAICFIANRSRYHYF